MRKGVPVSPGYAIGSAFVLGSEDLRIPRRLIAEDEIRREQQRFDGALKAAISALRTILLRAPKRLRIDSADIIESHIKILSDPGLVSQIKTSIANQFSPEYAVSKAFKRYSRRLIESGSDLFASRVQDLRDIEKRLLRTLLGKKKEDLAHLTTSVIVVAHELTPAETLSLDKTKILGFVTDLGGKTSHTAVIARALGIPAVVGVGSLSNDAAGSDTVIVDGVEGFVFVNPDHETLQKYVAQQRNYSVASAKVTTELKDLPAVTTDGCEAKLLANIELPDEIPVAFQCGAQGVGLFRTEFMFLKSDCAIAQEKEQYDSYKRSMILAKGREITFRTLDIGADKIVAQSPMEKEANPFLGCRAIRLYFDQPDILRSQLRAVLRAAEFGPARILFPMISGVEDMRFVKKILHECQEQLATEETPFGRNVEVGAMVEIPSAAVAADLLAKEVDFFSIGTNDLVQYTLAVDRGNDRIAFLYQPAHPAVLRLIDNVVKAGEKEKKPVYMCGEMAGDTSFTLLLLGLGLRFFSMASLLIPEVKRVVRSVSYAEAKKVANKVMSMTDPATIREFLKDSNRHLVPEVF
jgi:phosphotransferase system enzyme I (PtsI)